VNDSETKSKIRAVWESAAPGWAKWESTLSEALEGATLDLLDTASVRRGYRVLDVASGAGAQTLLAARRVGEEGSVVASDISATMLEHVRKNAEALNITNIELAEGTAEDVAADKGPFDAAICRLGLMLFPDPVSSVRAICTALNPGARFGALVVSTPDENPFFSKSMGILLRHAGKQPPATGQPGLFALSQPGALEGVLSRGGLEDVKANKVRASFVMPNATAALEMMREAFGAYRAVVADVDDAAKGAAWSEVLDFLSSFEGDHGLSAEFVIINGSGARPE
jgi:ubiquinone/menaquinone biosynthesis C-methylase UbiE